MDLLAKVDGRVRYEHHRLDEQFPVGAAFESDGDDARQRTQLELETIEVGGHPSLASYSRWSATRYRSWTVAASSGHIARPVVHVTSPASPKPSVPRRRSRMAVKDDGPSMCSRSANSS